MGGGGGGIHHATFKSRQTWGRGVICLVQTRKKMVAWPLHQASWLCFFLGDLKLVVRSLEL